LAPKAPKLAKLDNVAPLRKTFGGHCYIPRPMCGIARRTKPNGVTGAARRSVIRLKLMGGGFHGVSKINEGSFMEYRRSEL